MRWILLLSSLLAACGGSTDLTVAPPPRASAGARSEVPPPLESGRLPEWARPRRYDLKLAIDPAASRFSGQVSIEVTLDRPTAAIVLHAAEMEITRAEVRAGEQRLDAEVSLRRAAGSTTEAEELVLVLPREIAAGTVTVELAYKAPLSDKLRGIYRVSDGDRSYVFTQLEPSDARRMFPCFDDPIYKVPFDVAVTVPEGTVVLSNTAEKNRERGPDGRTTFTFETSRPMPSYLVALAVGPLEVRSGPTSPVPIRLVATPGQTQLGDLAFEIASKQLAIMTELFGSPYPYDKLDLVAVPNFGPGAMENAGLITFREELLLVDKAHASAKQRRDVAMILAHELAHQWFGNLVTMKWWDDLWLNEGFATYMEALVVDRYQPSMRAGLETLSLTGWVMDYDALEAARAVRQPVSNTYQATEAFDGITYVKGAAVIRMLHRWLGEDVFRDGVQRYLAQHAWRNAGAADLFAALGSRAGKDVDLVASSFVDQPGVPLVRAELVCGDGKPKLQLSQRRYRARAHGGGVSERLWKIPVCVSFGGPRAKAPERVCTLLEDASSTLELETARCPAWVLPNAGYDGYYRYSMPVAQLDALGRQALGQPTAEKIGFVNNMWALVQAGEVPATRLLDHLVALSADREREVIEESISVLHRISDALVTDGARDRFQAYVAARLLPTAKRLGWEVRPGDTDDDRLLRRSVLEALAVLTDDPWMAREAKKRAPGFLAEPDSVDPDSAPIALRVAARRGDVGLEALVARLKSTEEPAVRVALVQALGSLGKPDELRGALALVADGTVRAQDALYIVRTAAEWPDSRAVLVDWLAENLGDLAKRYPGFGAARMIASLRRICDPAARAAAQRAFTPLVRQIGASQRRLAEALEAAALCIDLRERQAKSVASYLEKNKN